MVNNIIKILLLVVIIVLGYLVFESVMGPVRFKKEVDKRSESVIQNMKDIRSAQMAYKNLYGKYTGGFDTLIGFIEKDSIPVVRMIPDPTDTTFTKTIRDTIGALSVVDSLFANRHNFNPEDIRYIPYTDKVEFTMSAGIIEKGGVDVNVFEVLAPYSVLLKDLDEQSVINLIAQKEQIERYPGLKVGSMTEANTDGNWE
ncbi:MAG TPA: hypothetical protein P5514_00020 [Bacteroidales bacterium]|nr:hypothetical protein [Bacteroidales bacterium]